jgi:hypothetical protein
MLRDITNMSNLADNEIDVVSKVLQQLKNKVQLLSKKNKELSLKNILGKHFMIYSHHY